MGKNTRYDKFRDRLRRRFSRSRTYTPGIDAEDTELIFDLSNAENIGNDEFLEKGPFNFVTVRNNSDSDVRIYLSNDLEVFADVSSDGNGPRRSVVTERIPLRYVSYLRVENLSGSDDISEGDVQVQVGNEVDSVELSLIKMSGLLDVSDESER